MTHHDQQRAVLVTGAGGGMCRGINAKLSDAGYTVLCADISRDAAEVAASLVRDRGGNAEAFDVDVADADSISVLASDIHARVGDVHALVNAAGILDRKYLGDHDRESFGRVIDINLIGPFRMIQEFVPQMIDRGWGRIVDISSIAGVTGYPYPSYAASKGGLSNLARSLVIDLWGTGVTINSVCPGVVDTPMVIQEVRDQVRRKVPTEQIIQPEEIGSLIVFLLSDDARSINGTDIIIDGGATRQFQLFDHS